MRRTIIYILGVIALAWIAVSAQTSIPGKGKLVRGSSRPDSVPALASDTRDTLPLFASESEDSVPEESGVISLNTDSLESDSTRQSISPFIRRKVDLEQAVVFSARDSIVMFGNNRALMYGNSTVKYGEIDLNAGKIEMAMDSSTVYASASKPDSIKPAASSDDKESEEDYPVFSDGSGEYTSKTMKYNFKTERGYITDIITEQGEGYLTGAVTKKMEDGSFNLMGGRYTTCDIHDHPHFYFQVTKGKMRPKKNIVTGPVYMVLADVPLPLALPFGFFPFNKDYSSGIIFPSFGEDYNRGFYLRDGGYYFAINDNVDLALRGEIYTRGSWGVSAHSSYVKRYRYRGNFDLSYITTIYGDKGDPDYSKQNNFRIAWTHTQDQKANPNLNFSASVNFTTSGYTRNDLNSYYNNSFTENTKSSTVNLTYRPAGSKWSVSANANVAQRTQDSTLSVSFPNLTVTLSQTTPFKRKRTVGAEKWYEKIRLSYSGQFQNSLTAQQNVFFKKSLVKDWRNAMKHNIPISATFSVFKYINVSPSITINDRMYFQKVRRQWDPNASAEVQDTTYGFYNVFDFNAAISLDTKIYGFWKPLPFLGDKIQMIRHVLTPSVSFTASPDFSSPFWGIYDTYQRPGDNVAPTRYSYFQGSLFGVPSAGKQGVVSVSLANNLEMKVKSDNDSTGVKKISLIENLTIGQSYNFAADSLNWSNINTSILLRLTRNFNLNLSATWDPYMYGLNSAGNPVRINKLRIGHKGLPRLASTGTSFSYSLNQDTFKKKKSNSSSSDGDGSLTAPNDEEGEEDIGDSFADRAAAARRKNSRADDSNSDADGYEEWTFPWSLSINYSIGYAYGTFNYDKMEYNGKWTQNLSLSGSVRPTKNWNFNFSASYNFDLHKIAYMNCSISRDLHCFTMTASFVPVGPYKSYNFHIAVKSSVLQDLKYDKRSSASNGVTWY